jgi:glutamate transport system permease protein
VSAPTAVLFDVPGPRARARNATAGVATLVLVAALVAVIVWWMAATGQLDGRVWEWILYENVQLAIVDGLVNTLLAFALGSVLALVFGGVFALGRLSDHAWLRRGSEIVVEAFRAVPLVVMMFIFYYGLPSIGITVSTYAAVVLGLTLYNGSVLAEVFRAGVLAVPRGQSEAAYALGLRKSGVMRFVLLPQAVRSMLPSIVSQLVVLLKDSALGFLILYPELLFQAQFLGSNAALNSPLIPVALVVAVIYITLCLLLSSLANWLERRTRRSPTVTAAPVVAPEAGNR